MLGGKKKVFNRNSVIYYHDNDDNDYLKLMDICTKIGLSLFDCQKLDILTYIMKNINPLYIIVNRKQNINTGLLVDFCNIYPNSYVFLINCETDELAMSNCFKLNDMETLYSKLYTHHKYYINHMVDTKEEKKLFYNHLILELDKLSFRPKLIGVKYLTDLVYELYLNSDSTQNKCCKAYNMISSKYNISIPSIEKAIRFSILTAYARCQNKQLFLTISKNNKTPTIKELANYLIDKLVYIADEKSY